MFWKYSNVICHIPENIYSKITQLQWEKVEFRVNFNKKKRQDKDKGEERWKHFRLFWWLNKLGKFLEKRASNPRRQGNENEGGTENQSKPDFHPVWFESVNSSFVSKWKDILSFIYIFNIHQDTFRINNLP